MSTPATRLALAVAAAGDFDMLELGDGATLRLLDSAILLAGVQIWLNRTVPKRANRGT